MADVGDTPPGHDVRGVGPTRSGSGTGGSPIRPSPSSRCRGTPTTRGGGSRASRARSGRGTRRSASTGRRRDNALILAGLVRYGLRDEATRLSEGLLSALGAFADAEPPELFCGYPAREYGIPVRYPTTCRPQAWASGAVLLLTRSLLGLDVDALAREVSVEPLAVAGLTRLTLKGVAVGGARVDVSVRRDGARGMVAELSGLPSGWRRVDRGS